MPRETPREWPSIDEVVDGIKNALAPIPANVNDPSAKEAVLRAAETITTTLRAVRGAPYFPFLMEVLRARQDMASVTPAAHADYQAIIQGMPKIQPLVLEKVLENFAGDELDVATAEAPEPEHE